MLMEQRYGPADDIAHIESLIPAFCDPRYIRVQGRPLFLVYRTGILPDPSATAKRWRSVASAHGIDDLFLVRVESHGDTVDPRSIGFDAAVEFAPFNGLGQPLFQGMRHRLLTKLGFFPRATLEHSFYDYRSVARKMTNRPESDYTRFHCVTPGWDNTARRKEGGRVLLNSHPDIYEEWLRQIATNTVHNFAPGQRLCFINAWNEWAEGAHLEPDQKYGHGYLSATYKALHDTHNWRTTIELLRHLPGKSIDYIHQLLDELERRMSGKNRSLQIMCQSLQESVVVSEISYCHNESDLWWNLESPSRDTFNDDALTIKGWVVAKKSPAVAVEVMCQGRLLSQTPVDIEREDVAKAHPFPGAEISGFSLNLKTVQLSPAVDLNLRTILKDGSYLPLAEVRFESALNLLQKQRRFSELKVAINPVVDAVSTIINVLRIVYDENMNVPAGGLLDELEKKIEAKEQLIEYLAKVIKQRLLHNPLA